MKSLLFVVAAITSLAKAEFEVCNIPGFSGTTFVFPPYTHSNTDSNYPGYLVHA
jgi:hypothetical protein